MLLSLTSKLFILWPMLDSMIMIIPLVWAPKLTNSSRGCREMGCGSALSVVLSDMVTWLYQWTMDSVSCICDGWQVATFFYLLSTFEEI